MNKIFKLAFSLLLSFSVTAAADAMDTVKSAMHNMTQSLQCIEGRLPAKLCIGDQFTAFRVGTARARPALLEVFKAPDKQQMIVAFFSGLEVQIGLAESALKAKNNIGFQEAISGIHSIMDAGHSVFAKQ